MLQIASSMTPRSGQRHQRWRRQSSVPNSASITGLSSLDGQLLPPHIEISTPFLLMDSLTDSYVRGCRVQVLYYALLRTGHLDRCSGCFWATSTFLADWLLAYFIMQRWLLHCTYIWLAHLDWLFFCSFDGIYINYQAMKQCSPLPWHVCKLCVMYFVLAVLYKPACTDVYANACMNKNFYKVLVALIVHCMFYIIFLYLYNLVWESNLRMCIPFYNSSTLLNRYLPLIIIVTSLMGTMLNSW